MEFKNCTFNNCTQQDIHDNNIVVEQNSSKASAKTKVTEVVVEPAGETTEEKSYSVTEYLEVKPSSAFHDIIQNVDEEKLMAELHRRITSDTAPSTIGKTLAYCHNVRQWFIRTPREKEFEKEFPNCGKWSSICTYFAEKNKEKAKEIVIDL